LKGLSSEWPPRGSQHPFGSGRSFHPLSRRLQPGVRLLRDPVPAMPSDALAGRLVSDQPETAYRGCHVPYMQQGASGSAFPPEVLYQRVPTKQGNNRPRPVWVGPINRFGPVSLTTFKTAVCFR
jgi:hypothetical protein